MEKVTPKMRYSFSGTTIAHNIEESKRASNQKKELHRLKEENFVFSNETKIA